MEQKLVKRAYQIADEALHRLAVDIKAGRSEALNRYLAAMGRFRRHSWRNVLLIMAQRPEATQVTSLRAWRAVGRFPAKGEKGIVILVPAAKDPAHLTHDAMISTDDYSRSTVRASYVYDVSQTEGKVIPERPHAANGEWEYGAQLRALAARRGIVLLEDRIIEPASGISEGGAVRLRPGLSPTQNIAVLAQELAREIVHRQPEVATWSRDTIEAQVEGVTYVVARGLGLEADTAVARSMASFCRDKEAFAQTLAAIHRTSTQTLDELVPQPNTAVGPGVSSRPRRGPPVEPQDFERIQREYGSRLIESITRFVRDRHRAEDLTARAFEKAWEKRENFRGESSLQTWIEAIARNEARRDWSRARHVQFESLEGTVETDCPGSELITDGLERREEHQYLQQALAKLPNNPRRALVAHFVEGLSIRDIARRERVAEGTVLSRIFTGKQLLREAWAAVIAPPAAEEAAVESPSFRPEGGGSPGSVQAENDHSDTPEPMTWER